MTTPQTVCFVSPHPDDIELFCGGALLHHYQRGDSIFIMMMTNGENNTRPSVRRFLKRQGLSISDLPNLRQQEAEARYALLPGVNVVYFKLEDGKLADNDLLFEVCKNYIEPLNPAIIYLPEIKQFSRYTHVDHLHLGQVVTELQQSVLNTTCLRYYHSNVINCFLNVSDTIQEAKSALAFFKSQALERYGQIEALIKKYYGRFFQWRYAECYRQHSVDVLLLDEKISVLSAPAHIDEMTREFASAKVTKLYVLIILVVVMNTLGLQAFIMIVLKNSLTMSLIIGTVFGKILDYFLKKNTIFLPREKTALYSLKTFIPYFLTEIVLIGIFWAFEYSAYSWSNSKWLTLFAGALGLTLGYFIRYKLNSIRIRRYFKL